LADLFGLLHGGLDQRLCLLRFVPTDSRVSEHENRVNVRQLTYLAHIQRREEISDELRTKGDAEVLAECTEPQDSEQYEIAGSYRYLVDGLTHYVSRRRERG